MLCLRFKRQSFKIKIWDIDATKSKSVKHKKLKKAQKVLTVS